MIHFLYFRLLTWPEAPVAEWLGRFSRKEVHAGSNPARGSTRLLTGPDPVYTRYRERSDRWRRADGVSYEEPPLRGLLSFPPPVETSAITSRCALEAPTDAGGPRRR